MSVAEAAIAKEVIKKRGSWYSIDGESLGQGKHKVAERFKENPELLVKVKERTLKEFYSDSNSAAVEPDIQPSESED